MRVSAWGASILPHATRLAKILLFVIENRYYIVILVVFSEGERLMRGNGGERARGCRGTGDTVRG
jgi:hypothetical protein